VTVTQDESPTAAFSFSPASTLEGNSIWSFADSSFATGAAVSHRFGMAGFYVVTLTVIDSSGQSATTMHTVTVTDELPTASFTTPGGLAGAAVPLSGSGSDPDGSVSFAWNFGDGQVGAGGKSLATARRALHAAGCAVGKVVTPRHHRHGKLVVKKESPGAGRLEPARTKIRLTFGQK
jgi:hypothetical protein